jgi:hypothetical protein
MSVPVWQVSLTFLFSTTDTTCNFNLLELFHISPPPPVSHFCYSLLDFLKKKKKLIYFPLHATCKGRDGARTSYE